MDHVVEVHENTASPDKLWREKLQFRDKTREVHRKGIEIPPCDDSKVRFVCISDTHSDSRLMSTSEWVPDGDVLIHAGDFSRTGRVDEVERFNSFLGMLPHRYKIVIAGNHEITFDKSLAGVPRWGVLWERTLNQLQKGASTIKDLLSNCTYLEDSETTVYGLRVYGSPWQPAFRGWAFNLQRGSAILEKWNLIPAGTDVLVTHGPPVGIQDRISGGIHVGCVELYKTVVHRVKPKLHVFGHIHEDGGECSNGTTHFVNAAMLDEHYKPAATPKPAVVDLPLPYGVVKS